VADIAVVGPQHGTAADFGFDGRRTLIFDVGAIGRRLAGVVAVGTIPVRPLVLPVEARTVAGALAIISALAVVRAWAVVAKPVVALLAAAAILPIVGVAVASVFAPPLVARALIAIAAVVARLLALLRARVRA